MDKNIYRLKLDNLKKLFLEFKEQYEFYLKQKDDLFIKKTSLLAFEKKLEEVIEYSIKINKMILKKNNIVALSYQESFLLLKKNQF